MEYFLLISTSEILLLKIHKISLVCSLQFVPIENKKLS